MSLKEEFDTHSMLKPASDQPTRAGTFGRTLRFIALVPVPVTVLIPWILTRPELEIAHFDLGPIRLAAVLIVMLGVLLFARSAREFIRAGGTPAPWDPPIRLAVGGPFAQTRNPIYLAFLGILLGEAILYGSGTLLAYVIALSIGFHLRIVLVEEPGLRRRFGDTFDEYCRFVPRWRPNLGKQN
jgi:protein-S-isoprenylcysteine O-methyltransferase Ste14